MALTMMKSKAIKDPAEIPLTPLEADARYRAAADDLAALAARIVEAEKRKKVAMARMRGQQSTASTVERAKALVAGGQIISLPAETELNAAEEELRILNAERMAREEKLKAVKGEIDFEDSKRFASVSADGYRMALDGLALLFQGLEITRVCRGRLQGMGRQPNEWALPNCDFKLAAEIGDPDRYGTAAWMFKQRLREKEIV
jgi:hypothetical protein